ncbi:Acetyl-coenzyme A synthetase chloroplastic/glyoxysomal [Bienertia sinuspersici]
MFFHNTPDELTQRIRVYFISSDYAQSFIGCPALQLEDTWHCCYSTTFKYLFDYKPSDICWCTADCGWIAEHSYVTYGLLLNGAFCIVFEGICMLVMERTATIVASTILAQLKWNLPWFHFPNLLRLLRQLDELGDTGTLSEPAVVDQLIALTGK